MNFYLTNTHRKYMGLKPLKEHYELVKIKDKYYTEIYLFFDKDNIKKIITYSISNQCICMQESDVDYQTTNNRTILLPKTRRGKSHKLNFNTAHALQGTNNYFYITYDKEYKKGYAIIGNYTTQKTFYEDNELPDCSTLEKIKQWCDNFVASSTIDDLKAIERFCKEARKHIDYQEGDYFRVKYNRDDYCYGRILMNIYKRQKKGFQYWNIVMGRPVIVEMFHIYTKRKDVTIEELENLKTFPSEYILENNLYYGDYEIIGHKQLPKTLKYPIMYGIDIINGEQKIILQCGEIHKEIEYNKDNLIRKSTNLNSLNQDFKNNGVGFSITNNPKTIQKCIQEQSNASYWNYYSGRAYGDLRSPENQEYLKKVLSQFNLEELITLYQEK